MPEIKIRNLTKASQGIITTAGIKLIPGRKTVTVDVDLIPEKGRKHLEHLVRNGVVDNGEDRNVFQRFADELGVKPDDGKDDTKVSYKAQHKGAGMWAIFDQDDKEVAGGLPKADAEAFNKLDDEGKAAKVAELTK